MDGKIGQNSYSDQLFLGQWSEPINLIFQESPSITVATNTFINIPVVLQYEDTPLNHSGRYLVNVRCSPGPDSGSQFVAVNHRNIQSNMIDR